MFKKYHQKFNKILICLGVGFSALAPGVISTSEIKNKDSVESIGVFVRKLSICHQREWRNLNVSLEYDADIDGKANNISLVKEHVKTFLENYTNQDDFWEVMNVNLVKALKTAYPDINAMKSTLSLAPDKTLGFPRESIVSYKRGSMHLKESFKFTKLNHLICQDSFRSLDLSVSWDVKDNPDPSKDYPDYQRVDEAMNAFFKNKPVSFSKWKSLKPKLLEYLLKQFPSLTSIDVQITVVE